MVAPSDSEARDRVFSEQGSNRYFYTYMREVLSRVGILSVMKPDPDMPDDEATVDVITEGCALYGSPKTFLDKLVAFRDDGRPVRHAADDRPRLERPQRRMGARLDAAPGARGDAEIPPARDGAGGGVRADDGPKNERLADSRWPYSLLGGTCLYGTGFALFPLACRKLHGRRDTMDLLRRSPSRPRELLFSSSRGGCNRPFYHPLNPPASRNACSSGVVVRPRTELR